MAHRAIATLLTASVLAAAAWLANPAPARAQPAQGGLSSFSSDAELRRFLRRLAIEEERERRRNPPAYIAPPSPPPSPEPASAPSAPAAPGITNNQIQGVDEGGIVKLRGDTLVILRRGRLFTVSLAGGALRPVDSIDAFPPGVDARGDWYDEMLVAGDRVVVIGYSYRRNGTQVNRFRLDPAGNLAFEDSYQLRSSDYYSSRNYATRLLGNRLVLYSPLSLKLDGDPLEGFPAMRQWRRGASEEEPFRRIAAARRVFIPPSLRDPKDRLVSHIHSITSCDLTAPVLDCGATAVLGSWSRTFFVSSNAVYLWVDDAWETRRRGPSALLYRIPFDQSRPSAVAARGSPVDQFSFMPDAARNTLHVVLRAQGGGDAMWAPEVTSGGVALLRIPMAAFGDGSREVPLNRYQRLPTPTGNSWSFHNRFVGAHLLYGVGSNDADGSVIAVSLAGNGVSTLRLGHGVDRIDAIGPDGIVIGGGGGALGFTAIDLSGSLPRVGEEFRLPAARQGESRSHAFHFRPDPGGPAGAGILGLPVARFVPGGNEYYPRTTAAMLFLTRRAGRMSPAGEIAAESIAGSDGDDACQASCVDWYGNARPIFIGDRIFALLGYELVEGRMEGESIHTVARTSFAPAATRAN